MKIFSSFFAPFFCLLGSTVIAMAQRLPKIEFQQVYTNLQINRLVWMSEAPDGSERLFAVARPEKSSFSKGVQTAAMLS